MDDQNQQPVADPNAPVVPAEPVVPGAGEPTAPAEEGPVADPNAPVVPTPEQPAGDQGGQPGSTV